MKYSRYLILGALMLSASVSPAMTSEAGRWQQEPERKVTVQTSDGERQLVRVAWQVPVQASPEQVWDLLADFGAVHEYFPAITDSDYVGEAEFGVGCARFCDIDFDGRMVQVKERVLEVEAGHWLLYDVYETQNFPIDTMRATFGVRVDEQGQTWTYNIIDYRFSSGLLTALYRGKMERSVRSTVLGIKHVVETGELLSGDELDALYPTL